MDENGLVDQELVAHVFAPLDGPWAATAVQQVRALWARCADQLGIDRPVETCDLPPALPEGRIRSGAATALALAENHTGDLQMIARREHDILNFSVVFAAPMDTEQRRLRIGSAIAPGWREFDRWWRQLSIDGVPAFLGTAVLYQAQLPDDATVALAPIMQSALPFRLTAETWLRQPSPEGSALAMWEFGSADTDPNRIFVVGAPGGHAAELSAWTWSAGGLAMPPLARYLMHAANLRHAARVVGDGAQLHELQQQARDRVDGFAMLVAAPITVTAAANQIRGLAAGEMTLVATLNDLQDMRYTVEIAEHNMKLAMARPCPADHALTELLPQRVGEATRLLQTALDRVQHVRKLLADWNIGPQGVVGQPKSVLAEQGPNGSAPPRSDRTELRLGFAVDIAGYRRRCAAAQNDVQHRLAALVREVVRTLGFDLDEIDRAGTGDGMTVILPPTDEIPTAVMTLLHTLRDRLELDNQHSRDRMRLRASAAVGLLGPGEIGCTGAAVVEMARLLDSTPLYEALSENPDSDLEFMISGWLYEVIATPEHPLLDSLRFARRRVRTKNYDKDGWLWTR
ncbi:CATRA conflict system CASPASE/TPR repeat-associated protein [Nocardia sp. NPDC051756]|uniref:CATRA conflict system CASPASE/TPR repeat-associated protein n=1 Tax=Nocardia sp. NPDC051756 TaxID=3154751 RepID=UPI00341A0CA5